MFVCVCKAVSDRQIRAAADSGVTSVRQLAKGLGVGTCCGKCLPEAQAILSTAVRAADEAEPAIFAAA